MKRSRCAIVGAVNAEEEDAAAVEAANQAFYEAFEQRDFEAISDCWEHSDRVMCTHPGWSTLHGWSSVSASWFALCTNAQRLQFILTGTQVGLAGDGAWVSCDENILDTATSATVAALNFFVRAPESRHGWLIVAHAGSLVHARADAP